MSAIALLMGLLVLSFLGSLIVANRQHRTMYTVADIARVKTFAAHASVALENARRQEALNRLNVLDEDRQRVASALHDTVIGRISRVSLQLHTMLRDDSAPEASGRIWEAIDDLDAAVKAIRDALFPSHES